MARKPLPSFTAAPALDELLNNKTQAAPPSFGPIVARKRISSIDTLRGIIMVIMALDHVRDYFHYDAFHYDPTDLTQTSVAIFFTRWITHFCAPVFVFLAGTAAFLAGNKMSGKGELSLWLLKRGFWLIVLEFTIVKFAWMFTLDYQTNLLMVIWALGVSMMVLAAIIHLADFMILALGLVIITGHNLLDNASISFIPDSLWNILHVGFSSITISDTVFIAAYPVLPWIGLMALGYYFGRLYKPAIEVEERFRVLIVLGSGLCLVFIVLRMLNSYGDVALWATDVSARVTVMSFLNTTKYPPSLLYLCMTMGPAMIVLAYLEKTNGWLNRKLTVIGRVPLFYYILHLYIIHLFAGVAAMISGLQWSDMIVKGIWINFEPQLQNYGFDLTTVYLVWILVVLILYPLCKWYNTFKSNHREKWWLSYL